MLIRKQDVLDIIEEGKSRFSYPTDALQYAENNIKSLPSAKPEIIRCKDCKHRDPEDHKCDCGHDVLRQLPRADEWFCADGERGEADDE